jgi:hypothetical protein
VNFGNGFIKQYRKLEREKHQLVNQEILMPLKGVTSKRNKIIIIIIII